MVARECPAREHLLRTLGRDLDALGRVAEQEVAQPLVRPALEHQRHEVGAVDVVLQGHAVQDARGPAHAGTVAEHTVGRLQHRAVGGAVAGVVERMRVDEVHRMRAARLLVEHVLQQAERMLHRHVGDRHAQHRQDAALGRRRGRHEDRCQRTRHRGDVVGAHRVHATAAGCASDASSALRSTLPFALRGNSETRRNSLGCM